MADEIKPEVPVVIETQPRTKEDWDKLAKENPARFAELSQPRIDELTRKEREAREKLQKEQIEKQNLLDEIQRLKQPPVVNNDEQAEYGNGKYPTNEEEWNNLFLERPAFANDLRIEFNNKQTSIRNDFQENISKNRKLVQERHPDMYLYEINDDGTPKKDDKGNLVNKLDPNTGEKLFNPSSDKGRLWLEIFNEDPETYSRSKNAPKLMMAEMERRQREKGVDMINNAQNNSNNDQSELAPQGVAAPKKSSLKFASEEERNLAQKSVGRGTYKNLEEYVEWRDKGALATFDHPNSRPDFQKR